jgi:hypothetical protein
VSTVCRPSPRCPAAFRRQLAGLAEGRLFVNEHDGRPISLPYAGQPYFVSEYGGIWWNAARLEDADDPERTRSVTELEADVRAWINEWNKDPRPFVWTKAADQILDTLAAYCQRITDSGH